MRVQSLGQEDPLEEKTATHSSILAWKIPQREEPGRLQSTGLQRVRCHLATEYQTQYTHAYKLWNENDSVSWPHLTDCPAVNIHIFPHAVPTTVLPESLLPEGAGRSSASKDEGTLCATGTIVAETQRVTKVAPHSRSWAEECGDVPAWWVGGNFS